MVKSQVDSNDKNVAHVKVKKVKAKEKESNSSGIFHLL